MNKKAQVSAVGETVGVAVGMFSFILMAVFMSFVLMSFAGSAQEMSFFDIPILDKVFEFMMAFPVTADWVALLLFGIGLVLSLFLLSKVEVGTAVYVLSFVLLFFATFGLIGLGIVLDAFVTSAIFAPVVDLMAFIPFYASNAVMFNVFYGFICLIALHTPAQ